MSDGTSRRASAITAPGIVLSQPDSATTASNRCPRATSSIESAITSRLTSDAFMPSVPIVMPSEIAIVLNSIGVPPAARMPSFTFADRRRRWKLHGIVPIHVFATPMSGLRRSSSREPDRIQVRARGRAVGPLHHRAAAAPHVDRGLARAAHALTAACFAALRAAHARGRAPTPQPPQVAPHLLRVDLPAGQVHVGVADQAVLVGADHHPLGEHVVGVGQLRPVDATRRGRGTRRSTRSAGCWSPAGRPRSACAG